jgi:methionyl-tRNA formyltransferase
MDCRVKPGNDAVGVATMRIIFMGTPDFAVPALGAVLAAGHEVAGVYTQPPRAAGRGLAVRKSPVQLFAESKGLPVYTPASLRSPEEQARFKDLSADAGVVVAYGQILSKAMLEAPRYGCFNIHASLLPRWRGAAPIQRTLLAGDAETGVAVMRIEEKLDTGAICLMERTAIGTDETAGELHDRLSELGAELMVRVLSDLGKGSLACWPQHDEGVTYATKIEPGETRIDWSRKADEVHNLIRGLSPQPGAWFEVEIKGKRERVRAMHSTLTQGEGKPGTVLDDQLTVACGEGSVRLLQVQRAGKRPMPVAEFRRGAELPVGSLLR